MCGLAGVYTSEREEGRQSVARMNAAQSHRGPDDEGLEVIATPGGCLVLGHRRLSILDLSAAGHQPMLHATTGNMLVFNGEIYNFLELREELIRDGSIFRSRSDTEVLLEAYAKWGLRVLERMEGMFAFALWDAARNELILARDPLGIKPLYYGRSQRGFVFASELRAIVAGGLIPLEVDDRAVAGFLTYGSVPSPVTMCRNVHLLPAGTFATVDLSRPSAEIDEPCWNRYWRFPAPASTWTAETLPSEVMREQLVTAVDKHLISDVPVGLFLSGGLDSSALAALAARGGHNNLAAFTVAFKTDKDIDESGVAEQLAARLGFTHHLVRLSDVDAQRLWCEWMTAVDQPTVDGLNTFIVARAAQAHGLRVALSGLGGDELLGGYTWFGQLERFERWGYPFRNWPSAWRQRMPRWLFGTIDSTWRRGVELLCARDAAERYFLKRRLWAPDALVRMGLAPSEAALPAYGLPAGAELSEDARVAQPLAQWSILDMHYYMANTLLRDADVFGMACELEIRVPMLHTPLAQWLLTLPPALRRDPRQPKKLLIDAMGADLPEFVARQPKRGFTLPYGRWMRGPLRDRIDSMIGDCAESGLLDGEPVRRVWHAFLESPRSARWVQVWALAALGNWLRRAASWSSPSWERHDPSEGQTWRAARAA